MAIKRLRAILLAIAIASAGVAQAEELPTLNVVQGDWIAHDFGFRNGRTLPALRLHYRTIGTPRRDGNGRVVNAVMILHGTGGAGDQFLRPSFAGPLFKPGGLLDPARYFIILPDDIGHGKSSKPSDGMHARFPEYDYDDMVAAEHALLVDGLGVDHLRLLMGTSMGCMHGFVWAETYVDFADALMPLACLPVAIAGRNRLWRDMILTQIRHDPAWAGGDYAAEPKAALEGAMDILIIAGGAPVAMQKSLPTRDAADRYLRDDLGRSLPDLDANDLWYQVNASRDYDPSAALGTIRTPILWINSADDFINPPELGIAEAQVKRIPGAQFVLLPIGPDTHGHGTHTVAAAWSNYLAAFLERTKPKE